MNDRQIIGYIGTARSVAEELVFVARTRHRFAVVSQSQGWVKLANGQELRGYTRPEQLVGVELHDLVVLPDASEELVLFARTRLRHPNQSDISADIA